jgi:hypothetical protein
MKVTERKLGRIFHLQFERDDHFYGELNPLSTWLSVARPEKPKKSSLAI